MYDHPDFKKLVVGCLMRHPRYFKVLTKNGLSVDDFVGEVMYNCWKSNLSADIQISTFVYNHTKWTIGKISRREKFVAEIFEIPSKTEQNQLEIREECDKILACPELNDMEREVLNHRSHGLNHREIGVKIKRSKQRAEQIL